VADSGLIGLLLTGLQRGSCGFSVEGYENEGSIQVPPTVSLPPEERALRVGPLLRDLG
jgi:hypothetical protein